MGKERSPAVRGGRDAKRVIIVATVRNPTTLCNFCTLLESAELRVEDLAPSNTIPQFLAYTRPEKSRILLIQSR